MKSQVLKYVGGVLLLVVIIVGALTVRGMRIQDTGGDWNTERDGPINLNIGQKLYYPDGSFFGTVVALDSAHVFPNGVVEAGAEIDYRPKANKTGWIPQKTAMRFGQLRDR